MLNTCPLPDGGGEDGPPSGSSDLSANPEHDRSTSDLHGDTDHTMGRVPIRVPMPDGRHSAIARELEY